MPITREGSSSVPRKPEPQVTTASSLSRLEWKIIVREDAIYILVNLQNPEEEDALYKIFLKQASKQGILDLLLYTKEMLQKLSYVDLDSAEEQFLQIYKIGKICMLFFYYDHL